MGRDGKLIKQQQSGQPAHQISAATQPDELPANAQHFEREWRRCCTDQQARYAFLRRLPPHCVQQLFRVEIKSTLLAQILEALASCWLAYGCAQDSCQAEHFSDEAAAHECSESTEDTKGVGPQGCGALEEAAWVSDILLALSHCGRFELSKKLLPRHVVELVQQLVADLQHAAQSCCDARLTADHVASVATAYGV